MATISINLNQIRKIDFIITQGMTAKQVYEKYKPDYIINGALYDVNTSTNITYCKDNGKTSGYLFSQEGLIIDEDKIAWDYLNNSLNDFIGGSPCLVKEGKKFVHWGNKYSSYVDGVHKRSCIGFNDTKLFLFSSDNEMSIDKTVDTCLNLGMKYAINLDGGGSCHLQKGKTIVKSSGRANCSWILVYMKQKENEGEETMEKVTVKCEGKESEGFLKDGTTYVPARFIADQLGATIVWDSKTKTVTITRK